MWYHKKLFSVYLEKQTVVFGVFLLLFCFGVFLLCFQVSCLLFVDCWECSFQTVSLT